MAENEPINIKSITGCGLGTLPSLHRRDSDVMCHSYQSTTFGTINPGKIELDLVDEELGTASCEYGLCNHLIGKIK